ncbi:delta-class carbonic anhydrase [Rhodovulum sp. DZ06]|uniref:delta-class carbonic anhydrase n=1 Tax=Rhodovulum sp. DZ06 TaxID=3425126 RepID=UPI003D332C99
MSSSVPRAAPRLLFIAALAALSAPSSAGARAAEPVMRPPVARPSPAPAQDPATAEGGAGVTVIAAAGGHGAEKPAAGGHGAGQGAHDAAAAPAGGPRLCQGFGPQTPRDIAVGWGRNTRRFNMAPPSTAMNLCNIHFHTQAEHKGPGFNIYAGTGAHGGWQCNATPTLTAAELRDPTDGKGACGGLMPGDTVEVHWVHSSCDVAPGAGLGSCSNDACVNPQLRVESQVFLVVNDPSAMDFADFSESPKMIGGFQQPKALPSSTGEPVEFLGSTTGTSYDNQICSPYQVTWSVRPQCARLDISSLHRWCEGNSSREDHAHGVRQLVTAPELLAPIE